MSRELLLSLRARLLRINTDDDGDCYMNESADALDEIDAALAGVRVDENAEGGCNKLDTPEQVRFYEHDFYPLSNFSAFNIKWEGILFDTSERLYHWMKFAGKVGLQSEILAANSAHEAFKFAERWKAHRRPDWDAVKLDVMRSILRAKADQHEYVRRKLLATGDRLLVEDSWRDDFWGWGPNRDGQNWLGRLWMELRDELRA